MRFFVSGKVGAENGATEVMHILRKAGHEITFDWTTIPHLRPYDINSSAARDAALLESRAVKDADILVLIPHERGVGLFVELGIAIGAGIPIRVITKGESQTMFFHHPLVKRLASVDELISEFC